MQIQILSCAEDKVETRFKRVEIALGTQIYMMSRGPVIREMGSQVLNIKDYARLIHVLNEFTRLKKEIFKQNFLAIQEIYRKNKIQYY